MSARRPETTLVAEVDDFKAFLRATRDSSAATPRDSPEHDNNLNSLAQKQPNPTHAAYPSAAANGSTVAAAPPAGPPTAAPASSNTVAADADAAPPVPPPFLPDRPAAVSAPPLTGPSQTPTPNQKYQPAPRTSEPHGPKPRDVEELGFPARRREGQGAPSAHDALGENADGLLARCQHLTESGDGRDVKNADPRRANGTPARSYPPEPVGVAVLVSAASTASASRGISANAPSMLLDNVTGTALCVTPLSKLTRSHLPEIRDPLSFSSSLGAVGEPSLQSSDELRSVEQELRYFATKRRVLIQAGVVQGFRESAEKVSSQLVQAVELLTAYQEELRALEIERGETDTADELFDSPVIPGLEPFDPAHGIDILNYLDDVERKFMKEEISWSFWGSLVASRLPTPLREAVKFDWRTGNVIQPWNWSRIKQSVGTRAHGWGGDLASLYLSKLENIEWDPSEGYLGFTQKALTYYIQWANAAGYPEKIRDGEQLQRNFLLRAVKNKLPELLAKDLPNPDKLTWREASTILDEAYKRHCEVGTPGIASPESAPGTRPPPLEGEEFRRFPEVFAKSDPRVFADSSLTRDGTKRRVECSPTATATATPSPPPPRHLNDLARRTVPEDQKKRTRCRNRPCYNSRCAFAHEPGQSRAARGRSAESGGGWTAERRSPCTKLFSVECRNYPCSRPSCTFRHLKSQKPWKAEREGERADEEVRKRGRDPDYYDNHYHRGGGDHRHHRVPRDLAAEVSPSRRARANGGRSVRLEKDGRGGVGRTDDGWWESRDEGRPRRRSAQNASSGLAEFARDDDGRGDVLEGRDGCGDDERRRSPYRQSFATGPKRQRRSDDEVGVRPREADRGSGRAALTGCARPWQADIDCWYKPCTNRNCKYRHREGQWHA